MIEIVVVVVVDQIYPFECGLINKVEMKIE